MLQGTGSFARDEGAEWLEKGRRQFLEAYSTLSIGGLKEAYYSLDKAYDCYKDEWNETAIAEIQYYMTRISFCLFEDYDDARESYELCLELLDGAENKYTILSTLALARLEVMRGETDKALDLVLPLGKMMNVELEIEDYEIYMGLRDMAAVFWTCGYPSMAMNIYESIYDPEFSEADIVTSTLEDRLTLMEECLYLSEYSRMLIEYGFLFEAFDVYDRAELIIDHLTDLGFPALDYYSNQADFFYRLVLLSRRMGVDINERKLIMQIIDALEGARNVYFTLNKQSRKGIGLERKFGQLYQLSGEYSKANRVFEKGLGRVRKEYGGTSAEMVRILTCQASCLLEWGKVDKARRVAGDAVQICRELKRFDADAYKALSEAQWRRGRRDEASATAAEAVSALKDNLHMTMVGMTAEEREHYWHVLANDTMHSILLCAANPSDDSGTLFDAAMLSKDFLMAMSDDIDAIVKRSGNGVLMEKNQKLKNLQHRYERLSDGMNGMQPEVAAIRHEIRELELDLQEACAQYGSFMARINCDWKKVEACLGKDEAAIEFVTIPGPDGVPEFCASVLRAGSVPVNFVLPVQDPEGLRSMPISDIYGTTRVYEQVFEPMEGALQGVRTIYFSPSAELSPIAIENLPVAPGKRMYSRYAMRRVSSSQEIIRIKKERRAPAWTSAALFGGLDYSISAEDKEYYSEIARSRGDANGMQWQYLPGTLEEVTSVSRQIGTQPCTLYTEEEGVEENFKALSGRKTSLIHIATHGFYDKEKVREAASLELLDEDDMLSMTYLVFAGANNPTPDRHDVDDGLLTAWEIAHMDLSGCDLLVLSACGTGLGIQNFNETYGLLRGFKKAGCTSILSSLWDVDDTATSMFMKSFYKGISSGLNKYSALEEARNTVRNVMPDPRYWAGFVLVD